MKKGIMMKRVLVMKHREGQAQAQGQGTMGYFFFLALRAEEFCRILIR